MSSYETFREQEIVWFRGEVDRLRAELKQARTIKSAPTLGVEPSAADRIDAAFRDLGASAEQIERIRAIRRSAERFAAQREHDVNEWRGRPIVEAPNPTPAPGSEVERILAEILAEMRELRADLRRASEVRR